MHFCICGVYDPRGCVSKLASDNCVHCNPSRQPVAKAVLRKKRVVRIFQGRMEEKPRKRQIRERKPQITLPNHREEKTKGGPSERCPPFLI